MAEFRLNVDASEMRKVNDNFKVSLKEWKDMLKADIKARDETTSTNELKELNEQIKMLKNVIKSETGVTTTAGSSGGMSFGKGAGMVAVGSAIFDIARNTQAIKTIMDVISGLLNTLIAPLVPIVVGLLKPFLVAFNVIGFMLARWLAKQLNETHYTAMAGIAMGAAIGGVPGAIAGGILGEILGSQLQDVFNEAKELFGFTKTEAEKVTADIVNNVDVVKKSNHVSAQAQIDTAKNIYDNTEQINPKIDIAYTSMSTTFDNLKRYMDEQDKKIQAAAKSSGIRLPSGSTVNSISTNNGTVDPSSNIMWQLQSGSTSTKQDNRTQTFNFNVMSSETGVSSSTFQNLIKAGASASYQ
jgi:hypothetical protein